jgi:hypothetical protein
MQEDLIILLLTVVGPSTRLDSHLEMVGYRSYAVTRKCGIATRQDFPAIQVGIENFANHRRGT